MELRHLRAFEAAARLLHFRRAAEELHLAQPSLSTQIAALERELGTPLFDRVGRRVRLTAAGEELLPHARRILDAVAEARRAVAAHEGLEGGRVRVGAPPTVGTRLLPAALTLFHARYPGPEILLREEGTGELLALVEHGELDLAVVILPLVSPALEVTPLLEEDIVVAVGAQHRLAGATAVAMTDLADEPFLLLGEGYEVRRTTLDACRAAGFHPYVVLEGGRWTRCSIWPRPGWVSLSSPPWRSTRAARWSGCVSRTRRAAARWAWCGCASATSPRRRAPFATVSSSRPGCSPPPRHEMARASAGRHQPRGP